MTEEPHWLPAMMLVSGDWNEVVRRLYNVFASDFISGRPRLGDLPVWWDRQLLPGDRYEEGFWHLVSRTDPESGDRLPDFRRAERLPWCAPTIAHVSDPSVTWWDYEEAQGRVRTYVWLRDFDYVVVLQKKHLRLGTVAFLITAFHVDGHSSRRGLQRKYEQRWV